MLPVPGGARLLMNINHPAYDEAGNSTILPAPTAGRQITDVQGYRTINVTGAAHPYGGHWWPAGHIIGYEHTFVHAIKDLLDGIKTGNAPAPTFEDGFRCQAVLDAVERSAASRTWERPEAV